ncbi:MAG TPA: twin-arginine translocase TatA/TatE family subunit [Sumerlaeia bacterium]|nr:twin-arginine translocase TatA/TatE family subunit [Sumerlaeia bacterium]
MSAFTAIYTMAGIGMPGGWEIVILFAIILIIFGPKRLPELSRAIGRSITDFKRGMRDIKEDIDTAGEESDLQVPEKGIRHLDKSDASSAKNAGEEKAGGD